ncbi:MAG: TonB family protein [Arenicellales bacterium]
MLSNHSTKVINHSHVLGWFVLVSVLVHGLFLLAPVNKTEKILYVNLSSPLQVTVISSRSAGSSAKDSEVDTKPEKLQHTTDDRTVVAKAEKKSDIAARNNASTKPDSRPAAKKNSIRTNPKKISSRETLKESPISPEAPVNIQNVPLNHLRQQLKQMIRTRFTYPRMARRMGWEGLVGLSLHIEKDGSLNQVRVARSSGHKVLDDNARKTIQNIGRIQVASNLTIQAVDTEIEVLYRLTD